MSQKLGALPAITFRPVVGAKDAGDDGVVSPLARAEPTSHGAEFSSLRGASPEAILARVEEVSRQVGSAQLGRSGHHISLLFSDGLFESADERVEKALLALGLKREGQIEDPRTGRSNGVHSLGNVQLTVGATQSRTETLSSIARRIARGEQLSLHTAGHSTTRAEAETMLQNSFSGMIRKRGLEVHCRDLGPSFVEMLTKATAATRLLVLGCGEARFEKELLSGSFDRGPRDPQVAELAARKNKPTITSVDLGQCPADLTGLPNHRFLSGLFANIDEAELARGGKYHALVDMIACFTYSPSLSEDMNKALRLLETGGHMWIRSTDAVLVLDGESLLLFPEWLARQRGVEVAFDKPPGLTDGTYFGYTVTKREDDARVAPLRLAFEADHYPRATSTVHIFQPV